MNGYSAGNDGQEDQNTRTTNGPPKIPVRKSALPLLKGVKTSSKQGLPGPPQSLGTRRTTGSSRLSTISDSTTTKTVPFTSKDKPKYHVVSYPVL
jgi:hypothetical protein